MSEILELVKRRVEINNAFAADQLTVDEALAQFRATNLDEDSIAKCLVEATAARPVVTARPRSAHEALRIHALAIAHCKKYGGTWILDEALRVSTPFLSESAD